MPVGFWAKQAVSRVVGRSALLVHAPPDLGSLDGSWQLERVVGSNAGLAHAPPNLGPLDGGWQLYAEKQARAGGLVLGLRALEGETGYNVARWLVMARMAAAGSKLTGA